MRTPEPTEIESLAAAELVEALRQGFAGRPSVCMGDLAKLLMLDEKTLLRHVRSGRLPFRPVGNGRKRIRRRFTLGDVLTFYRNLGTPARGALPPGPGGVGRRGLDRLRSPPGPAEVAGVSSGSRKA